MSLTRLLLFGFLGSLFFGSSVWAQQSSKPKELVLILSDQHLNPKVLFPNLISKEKMGSDASNQFFEVFLNQIVERVQQLKAQKKIDSALILLGGDLLNRLEAEELATAPSEQYPGGVLTPKEASSAESRYKLQLVARKSLIQKIKTKFLSAGLEVKMGSKEGNLVIEENSGDHDFPKSGLKTSTGGDDELDFESVARRIREDDKALGVKLGEPDATRGRSFGEHGFEAGHIQHAPQYFNPVDPLQSKIWLDKKQPPAFSPTAFSVRDASDPLRTQGELLHPIDRRIVSSDTHFATENLYMRLLQMGHRDEVLKMMKFNPLPPEINTGTMSAVAARNLDNPLTILARMPGEEFQHWALEFKDSRASKWLEDFLVASKAAKKGKPAKFPSQTELQEILKTAHLNTRWHPAEGQQASEFIQKALAATSTKTTDAETLKFMFDTGMISNLREHIHNLLCY